MFFKKRWHAPYVVRFGTTAHLTAGKESGPRDAFGTVADIDIGDVSEFAGLVGRDLTGENA